MTASVLPWAGANTPERKRYLVGLRLHDAGHCARAFGRAPDHAFRPDNEIPQFPDFRVILGRAIGKRESGRIGDFGLTAKAAQDARCFLICEPGKGSLLQRAVQQQDTRAMSDRIRRKERAVFCLPKACFIERREGIFGLNRRAVPFHQ